VINQNSKLEKSQQFSKNPIKHSLIPDQVPSNVPENPQNFAVKSTY
jgi:hypothetical protein